MSYILCAILTVLACIGLSVIIFGVVEKISDFSEDHKHKVKKLDAIDQKLDEILRELEDLQH